MKLINDGIEESLRCSEELRNLLYEKGYRVGAYYVNNNTLPGYPHDAKGQTCFSIAMPTYATAVEWIRVNFNYHITVVVGRKGYFYVYWIDSVNGEPVYVGPYHEGGVILYTEPQQAYEAALLYTLKNLIK